ncbi:MAG: hypothetical protein HXY50_03150 [Ignavibacteriaceae bacterium]|nr:hypothetical protein [Ignavibacteriaceae bacterium]
MKKFLILLTVLFVSAYNLYSIPAFARKYNMTCKTCHSPFPKLKAYGEEFAGNGFVLKDQDAPRYFVETGDEKLSLIRDLPLAVRLDGRVTFNEDKSKLSDFKSPLVLKLLSGGEIFKNVSYYIYYILEEGDVGKVEDAFIMFNKLFGSELAFSIGQFQVSDPLFKRELRLTLADYNIYKVRVGDSHVNLTYDRGIMLNYGFETGTDLTLEIVNGNGIGTLSNGNFDNDKHKNFLGRVSQDINEHLRIGAFGYLGKESVNEITNDLWMFGPDATFSIDPIELNVQFVERRDKDPFFFGPTAIEIKTRGAFAEIVYRPEGDNSNWYAVGLYNWVESNIASLDHKSASLHLGYLLARNIRLIGEYTHNLTDKYGVLSVGFISAF